MRTDGQTLRRKQSLFALLQTLLETKKKSSVLQIFPSRVREAKKVCDMQQEVFHILGELSHRYVDFMENLLP